jgi:type II secretory ATPase GspE/PulE/Tfp pilus assembly ATPase PilB-like protein
MRVLQRMTGDGVTTIYRAKGCTHCRNLGYSGRIGIYELLVPDDELLDRISSGATLHELRQLVRGEGPNAPKRMRTLRADGLEKVKAGVTTLEEVYRVTA